jgi:Tfp pilus assembly protein PilF
VEKPRLKFDEMLPQQKARALFSQAVGHHQAGRFEEALQLYARALAFDPAFADGFNNMAVALRKLQRFDAALISYQKSVALRSDHAGTFSNMGNVLNDMDRVDEALEAHKRAVELEPSNLLYLYNYGLVLRDAGHYSEAITYFKKVLSNDPNYPNCPWDLALTHLMAGDLETGFAQYDSRWKLAKSPPRKFKQPRWDGRPLAGKTLFIHREQGFGDAIQFARLIKPLKEKFGGRIILECQPELKRLFEQIDGVDELAVYGKRPPAFDVWIPLMSLAQVLEVGKESIPGDDVFLKPFDPNHFKIKRRSFRALHVGVVWAGSPTHQNDRRRSVEIEHFLKLASFPDVIVFSLQKGERAKDLETSGANCFFVDAGKECHDFADSSSLLAHLDLIITIDTSVAHLAGAMGKEVWLMLPFTPDWRWMNDRSDSPWYPNMTIFRQKTPGDWAGCFEEMYQSFSAKRARK